MRQRAALVWLVLSLTACSSMAPYTIGATHKREGPFKGRYIQCNVFLECESDGCYALRFFARSLVQDSRSGGVAPNNVLIPWKDARYLRNGEDRGGYYTFDGNVLLDVEGAMTMEEMFAIRQKEADERSPTRQGDLRIGDAWPSKDKEHDYKVLLIPKAFVKPAQGPKPAAGFHRITASMQSSDAAPQNWDVQVFDLADHDLTFTAWTEDQRKEQVTIGMYIKKN